MSHDVTVSWSIRRPVSTTCERMVSDSGDHTVLDADFVGRIRSHTP